MTKKELEKQYKKNRTDIAKLYSTHTPLKTIEELDRQNEIAYRNELEKIEAQP